MPTPVTDPALLEQLEAAPGSSGPKPVTDPDLLKQLETPAEDVTAGMALRGIPVLGAYIPQAEAAIRAVANPLTGVGEKGATWAERYARNLPGRKAIYAQAERESPIASTALQMGGGAAALAPIGATALGARALGGAGTLGQRLLASTGSGAGISAADALARGEDPTQAAAIGGAVGAALPVVGGAVRRAITPFPVRDPGRAAMVAALEREGVQPTAGQQLGNKAVQYTESTLGDYPLAGGKATAAAERSGQQFTRAALRRLGLKGDDITPAAVDRAVTDIENEFQRLSASTTINLDKQAANDLGTALNRYGRKLPSQQRDVINNIVDDIVAQGKTMPGDVYQTARSDLSRMAHASRRTDPAYSDALRGLRNALDGAMRRSLTPQERGAWERARHQWGNWRILENAVKNTDAAGNVRITPAQLAQSAATRDRGGFGRGLGDFNELARAGKSILTPLPQSGTTPRAIAAGIMPALLSPAGLIPAAAGVAAPALGGRAMMSRPGQAYLRNQLMAGRGPRPEQAGLLGLLSPQMTGAGMPQAAGSEPQRAGPVEYTYAPGEIEDQQAASFNGAQGYPDFRWVNPAGVAAFLASGPMSKNIEDRRGELTEAEAAKYRRMLRLEGRADGGPVDEGEPYLVGERGPEVVLPKRDGEVLPANDPFVRAALRTGHRGRQEGAGTRFVEGGYGVPSLYRMLDEGAQKAIESAGTLQRTGDQYDPAPVLQQAIGAVGAPLVAPAEAGAVLGAGLVRRAAIPQVAKAELKAADAPGIRAYHGSPHDFDRFDISQVGTRGNEGGGTTFGRGLYFAEDPKAAEIYRRPGGKVYEADLAARPEELMQWSRPEQSALVKGAASGLPLPAPRSGQSFGQGGKFIQDNQGRWFLQAGDGDVKFPMSQHDMERLFGTGQNNLTGGQIYRRAASDIGEDAVVDKLRQAGVKGFQYPDEHRLKGSNYSIIRDDIISIVKKYGLAGAATMLGISRDEAQAALGRKSP